MRLSRTLTKQEGSTEAGQLPTRETEVIYGPWRVGLGYGYSWGGTILRWGNWKGRGRQSETTLDYLDNERKEKRIPSLKEGLVRIGK